MNIVVAGDHSIALRLIEALMSKHQVVYVGDTTAHHERFERLDVHSVNGPITAPETLKTAGVSEETEVFVACSSSDEQNIIACLAAQGLGVRKTTCLLPHSGFLNISEDDDALAASLGIDSVVRPAQQLADEIVRIVAIPGALDVESFADGRISLLRFGIESGAMITTAPLKSLKLPTGALLVTVRRGEELFLPSGNTRIRAGDKIIAMGRRSSIQRLLPMLREDSGQEKRRAAIIGAGSVGLAVARALEEAHWRLKVIESDHDRCEQIAPQLDSLVLHGDGGDIDLLEQEHIDEEPVLVAVTNNDEKNLLVSLLAKQLGVRRIITRADHLAHERMFERVGIDVVRSAHGAAIRTVLRDIDGSEANLRAELEHGDASIIEITLPVHFKARSLKQVNAPKLAVVGTIMRGRTVIVPGGDDVLRPHDHILVFCMHDDADEIRDYFHNAEEQTKAS